MESFKWVGLSPLTGYTAPVTGTATWSGEKVDKMLLTLVLCCCWMQVVPMQRRTNETTERPPSATAKVVCGQAYQR